MCLLIKAAACAEARHLFGCSYERSAISEWLAKANTSPMTNEVLVDKSLHPNVALKSIIANLLSRH